MPGYLTLPEWFLRVMAWAVSAFVLLFVPWAAWMSRQVIEFGTHLDQIPALSARVEVIETNVNRHEREIRRMQMSGEFRTRKQ